MGKPGEPKPKSHCKYLAAELPKVTFIPDPVDQNWFKEHKLTEEQAMDIVVLAYVVSLVERLSPIAQQVVQRPLQQAINSISTPTGAKISISMTAKKELVTK